MILKTISYLRVKDNWTPLKCNTWLLRGIRASIKELLSVWLAGARIDAETGLSKYHTEGIGIYHHFDTQGCLLRPNQPILIISWSLLQKNIMWI